MVYGSRAMLPSPGIGLSQRRCPWCQKTFRKRAHLARHVTSHTHERPFTCATCQKTFTRHDSLLRHTRLHSKTSDGVAVPSIGSNGSASPESALPLVSPLEDGQNNHQQLPIESIQGPQDSSGIYLTSSTSLGSYANPYTAQHRRLSSSVWDELAGSPQALQKNSAITAGSSPIPNALLIRQATDAALYEMSLSTPLPIPTESSPQAQTLKSSKPHPPMTCRHWFTYTERSQIELHDEIETSNMNQKVMQLDDRHRIVLHDKLYQRPTEYALPSTEFLNVCITRYFSIFHTVFPVLHLPTFRVSMDNTLVLLAISCIGSLFQGHKQAVQKGQLISEQLNKAVLNSWISSGKQTDYQALNIAQAAVLGQTYALLSGTPKNLAVLSSFHGTVLSWSKQAKYMEAAANIPAPDNQNLEQSWATWVLKEQQKRIAVTLHIHDFELSRLFICEPTLHHSPYSLPWLAPADVWDAPSAYEWNQRVGRHLVSYPEMAEHGGEGKPNGGTALAWEKIARQDHFNVGMKLLHIAAMVIEDNRLGSLPQTAGFVEKSLMSICKEQLVFCGSDQFHLRSLWHSVFIASLVDIGRLEQAVGKHDISVESRQEHIEYATRWAVSLDAHRAVLHGLALLHELESVSIREVTPVHVTSSLYHAAMVWYCFLKFSPPDRSFAEVHTDEFPEFTLFGILPGALMREANDFRPCRPSVQDSIILSGLIDMLNRIGYWGLSRSVASLFIYLTTESTDNSGQL